MLAVLLGNGAVLLGTPDRHDRLGDSLVAFGLAGLALLFVLSGFLLFRPFVAALVGGRTLPRMTDYYRNRLLRVGPGYATVPVLGGLLLGLAAGALPAVADSPAVRSAVVLSWSLVALVGCYLLLPVLVLLASALTRQYGALTASVCAATVLLVLGVAGRLAFVLWSADRSPAALRPDDRWYAAFANSFVANADLFAMGMVVAVVVVAAREWVVSDGAIRRLRRAGAAMMLVSSLGFIAFVEPVLAGPFFGLACAGLLVHLALPSRRRLRRGAVRVLETPLLRGLGRISYSVWLWHVPLMCFLAIRFEWMVGEHPAELALRLLGVTGLTLLLSFVTYRFVEAPVLRSRHRRTRQLALPHQRDRSAIDWTSPLRSDRDTTR